MTRKNLSKIDKNKTALIIIDVINYFKKLSDSKTINNITMLHQYFNESNLFTVLTRHGHTGDGDLGMLGKFYNSYISIYKDESKIIDALPVCDDNLIIIKKTYDAFWETGLDELLKAKHIEQVIITGCLTHLCCETTARSAFVRGYEVFFASDATFTSSQEFHKGTLLAMADGFARVITTKELLQECMR